MAVLKVRDEHPAWGGRKIATQLRVLGAPLVPAPSTITSILARNGRLTATPDQTGLTWLAGLFHRKLSSEDAPESLIGHPDLPILLERLRNGRLRDRKRSVAVLANRRGLRSSFTCTTLNLSRQTYRRYVRLFDEGGAAALFAPLINPNRKFDNEKIRNALFNVLHQPPSNFDINRTTWTMAALSGVMKASGEPVAEDVIRTMLKQAGYRWRKARIVLTSNDPEFSEKLGRIQSILSGLQADEAFFSIDEFGPFAVKSQLGRALVGPGERRFVPQWQISKGCVIVTAAIEPSSNQVSHFYSDKKNTDEMIRMMELLVDQYRDRKKIYLSWDAASWHISKKLFERIDKHNVASGFVDPVVETAPLPARAQFLNVIESIFSGMSRAVIQNSNYGSVNEAKTAMDRYFSERNAHFKINPQRAGRKIWGQERGPAEFLASNNCKDPRFR
jgi:transposase